MTDTANLRAEYERRMADIRSVFERAGDGALAVSQRTALVDELTLRLWSEQVAAQPELARGVAIGAVGGYGRRELFPHSDIDLLFLTEKTDVEPRIRDAIRVVSQALWDCGLKLGMSTRTTASCERFETTNPEFGMSLLDFRALGGDAVVIEKMQSKCLPRLLKDAKAILAELSILVRERHNKYGNTLFHLEPNIKDCPGGMRDMNVSGWVQKLAVARGVGDRALRGGEEFEEARSFLFATRCFLHYRHERDDNTLDWRSQDAAAAAGIGLGAAQRTVDASYWMRAYFRNARAVERRLARAMEIAGIPLQAPALSKSAKIPVTQGVKLKDGRVRLAPASPGQDPSHEPDIVLDAFAIIAATGAKLDPESEERVADAIPALSTHLEEGPGLWRRLCAILTGGRAGVALRSMHALGVLELILPEFHGIDALVIRDAYHRYTVDEHTFVVIDTLHALGEPAEKDAPDWRKAFGAMLRDLPNQGLLYLAALLHDTGKGRAGDHAVVSAAMAERVLARLEMDSYDASMVLRLIRNHLEMSAALRRDIFDAETVRAFAAKVQTQEQLRMLTLFTYADITAVHPDALTPWKAENLWRLAMAAANQLDRNVDEERLHAVEQGGSVRIASRPRTRDERITRILALARGHENEVEQFLEGFPERYLVSRAPETIYKHFEQTRQFAQEPFGIDFRHGNTVSEITLVTQDRPRLFANMAAALAAWGMNILTADAFANGAGVVVDSFRFTDTFRTLELNGSERERFVASVRNLIAGRESVEKMLSSRRRGRRKAPRVTVETRIEFDDTASSHSTLLQVVAQDVPGLLRAISAAISGLGHNVEVALIDTEGETAFDVFYLTRDGHRLSADEKRDLGDALEDAIAENAR